MASSSSYVIAGGNVDSVDVRYDSMNCHCNCRAALRIVGPSKASRGKLYFTCNRRACDFFCWCKPVSVSGIALHTPSERVTNEVQSSTALASQLHSLSQTVASLRKLVQVVMLLVILMVVVVIFKW